MSIRVVDSQKTYVDEDDGAVFIEIENLLSEGGSRCAYYRHHQDQGEDNVSPASDDLWV
ncbi:hypothetical protein [Rhodoligotrophos defluvii]|uniref:hypothetical protein n=1 Tax=Rhodoligotrophos defluvii TaxID=2561934 RepID=UPI00148583EC|nr:hypothetical protein [Rhodoligotrophos defluvii]